MAEYEEKFYDVDDLNEIFAENKERFDKIYDITKGKYDDTQANRAMFEFLNNYRTDFITHTDGARSIANKFMYHGPEIEQFLMSYAMESYILNGYKPDLTSADIDAYTNEQKDLKYDPETIISVVALGTAWNAYWFSNVLACNKRLKQVLIQSLIKERYVENRREELDNSQKISLATLKDGRKLTVSVANLNRNIDNMIHDDEGTYYRDDPEDYSRKGREK